MQFRKKSIGLWSRKQQLKYTVNKKGEENWFPAKGNWKKQMPNTSYYYKITGKIQKLV